MDDDVMGFSGCHVKSGAVFLELCFFHDDLTDVMNVMSWR